MRSDVQSITIDTAPAAVHEFVADPANLPRWAVGFAQGVRREDGRWIVQTAGGDVPVDIEADAGVGVIDFHLRPVPGVRVTAYSRVVPAGAGALYTFAQIQPAGMPDDVFDGQVGAVPPRTVRAQGDPGGGVPDRSLEALAAAAVAGDASALEAVLAGVRDDVYGLALRMLWHPEDAADATQDILIKVMTRLGTYRGEAALRTWVFGIAANHLRTVRRSRVEQQALSFDAFAADLLDGLADPPERGGVDVDLLEAEVKIGCTHAMLLCLDRDHRLAFVLGAVFELPGADAAAICDIDPPAYRKRLSRARARIRRFMDGHCGLVNPDAVCTCARRIRPAVSAGRVDPQRLLFAATAGPAMAQMEHLHATAAIFRAHPRYAAPARVVEAVRAALGSGRYPLITAGETAAPVEP